MKNLTMLLLSALFISIIGCNEAAPPDNEYTTNLSQAQTWFVGRWKLIEVNAQVINPPVPNVEIVVESDKQITVLEDGKQIDKVHFEITKTADYLKLETDAQPRSNNWYVRNPTLYISRDKMLLDTGMAFDAPGFVFERINF